MLVHSSHKGPCNGPHYLGISISTISSISTTDKGLVHRKMQAEVEILSNVTRLEFVGSGHFSVDDGGVISLSKGVKVVQSGGKVTFTSPSGGSVTSYNSFGGGQSVIGNNCSSIIMGSGNSMMVSSGRGGGGKNIQIVNGNVYINGKLVDESGDEPTVSKSSSTSQTDEPADKQYKFQLETTSIGQVTVTGSFTVARLGLLNLADFTAELRGSGDIALPSVNFESLTLKLTGSGDISGSGSTTANTASIMLTGSGDINRVHILSMGNVMLSGSGDIDVTKSGTAKVQKMCSRSGDLSVKTR